MKAAEKAQYVIYSRKSRFTGKGESIENQIELCRQYIAANFGQEAADQALVYEDEGFSGGNLERPQFKKMMQDSRQQRFAAIVVYRLDRISRNIGDFANLIQDLGDRHIDFVSIREQFDTSSPLGRAMMYIASVFSQLERETIAERIRDNMHELAKTGRWLGGNTPTGYASESASNVSVDGKVRKACFLKVIPEEITLVQLIFEKFFETGSLTKTEAFLLEKRYTTKRGNQFTRFAIKNILTNPVYMIADEVAYDYLVENKVDLYSEKSDFDGEHGIMAYNRTEQRPGKANQIRPMDEWIVSVGKHQGIIPGERWIQVQTMLDANKSKSYRRPRSNVALLSGLLRCGDCGDYMRPKLTNRKTAEGDEIYTYLCSTKEHSKGACCRIKNANGNTLDAKIIAEIKELAEDKEMLATMLTKTKKIISGNQEGFEAEIEKLKERISENESAIKSLVAAVAKVPGSSAEKYIMEQIDELHATGEAYRRRLDELTEMSLQHRLANQEFDLYREMLDSFAASVDDCTVEEKRRLLRAIVKKVVWDGENVYVYLFAGEGEADLPPIDAPEVPLGENSKCNTITTDFIAGEVEDQSSFGEKWRPLCHICDEWYVMISNLSGKIRLAPLEILRFPLLAPRKLLDAQKFNIKYTDPSHITEIADKLRWYRYQRALMQKEVAEQIGIDRTTYIHYEEYGRDYYPIEHMEKLAGLYDVPVEELLDGYNLFLYKGQGEQIQIIRQSLGLTQKQYAERLGVPLDNLRKWEQNRVWIYKSTWEKYFQIA